MQYPQEYQIHVQCTPIMDQRVNKMPQQTGDGTHTSCPPPLPQLSRAQGRNTRCIHVDEISIASPRGKLPK